MSSSSRNELDCSWSVFRLQILLMWVGKWTSKKSFAVSVSVRNDLNNPLCIDVGVFIRTSLFYCIDYACCLLLFAKVSLT